jgi:ABC-2 type transport system permease protein
MRKILSIIWKDTQIRFSSLTEWLFFLILPVFFTFVLAGGTGAPRDSRILLLVVDKAESSLSVELIASLADSKTIRPELVTPAKADEQFSQRRVSAVLVIPAEFSLDQLVLAPVTLEVLQQQNSLNALVVEREVQSIVSRTNSTLEIASGSVAVAERAKPFLIESDQINYFNAALKEAQRLMTEAPVRLDVRSGDTPDSVEYDPQANSSAGQLITWVFIPLIGLSGMFAYERQKGTLKRLLTTPTSRATFMLGTITGQVLTAMLQMIILIGFGVYVMHVNWGQNLASLAVILISSAISAASMGTMLGAFVKTESQAGGLSIMIGMLMALLGGCWYPLELFPAAIQNFVKILPTTWAMQGMLDVAIRGQGVAGILLESFVLLGFAAVFFTIGVLRFRFES